MNVSEWIKKKNVHSTGIDRDVINTDLIFTHRPISLAEAISLADSRKRKHICSSPVIFIDSHRTRKKFLKKVQKESPRSFKHDYENHEIVTTMIDRHFQRLNGASLGLAETCVRYYYVGVERSVEVFKALEVDDIPMRDESCANLEDFYQNT